MPNYWESDIKVNARKANMETYRDLTGRTSLPSDRNYWTLCNLQPPKEGTEIVQMERCGFLEKSQFFGVDRDNDEKNPNIIKRNKEWHPEANWYRGDWLKVIRSHDNFNPALVYLDTTSFAEGSGAVIGAFELTASTMPLCPSGTVLLVNVMLNDPRSRRKFNPKSLIQELRIPEIKNWQTKVPNYQYSVTGKTVMLTYVFYKMERNENSQIF